jgi:hypothetical protein
MIGSEEMMDDRELDNWRKQWFGVAEPLPDIQRKINRHNLRFVLGNLLAGVSLVAGLIFAVVVERMQPSMGKGWTAGIFVLLLGCAGYRLWLQRGTWRAETQSSRAFVELWHRRVMARLRMMRIANYVIPAWIVFCAVLAAVNWKTIGPDVKTHPAVWLGQMVTCLLVLPVIFFVHAWYRRRKLAELAEIKRILDEMED